MIVACPSCRAKFRIDETKIKPPGVRLRCARCQSLFAVRKRVVESPAASAPAAVAGSTAGGSRPRILVAHAKHTVCATMSGLLEKENFEVVTSQDGVDALMKIQREHPAVAVIDAALPKMYGFEICEFLKRNESLCNIKVLLVEATHNQGRYKRTAENLYGADDVLGEREIREALVAKLHRLLSGSPERRDDEEGGGEAQPAPGESGRVESSWPPVRSSSPFEEDPGAHSQTRVEEPPHVETPVDDPHAEERERACRLARIIVSDIALYNPDRFEEGIRSGQLANLVRDELEEGYKLFRRRIKPPVVDACDFIREALDAASEKKSRELGLSDLKGEGTVPGSDEGARHGGDFFADTGVGDDDI